MTPSSSPPALAETGETGGVYVSAPVSAPLSPPSAEASQRAAAGGGGGFVADSQQADCQYQEAYVCARESRTGVRLAYEYLLAPHPVSCTVAWSRVTIFSSRGEAT